MSGSRRHPGIEKPRRSPHVWFFATLGTVGVLTLIAFLVLDTHHRMRIGITTGMVVLFLTALWLNLHLGTVNEKDNWLDAAQRQDDLTEDEEPQIYYVEMDETRTTDDTTAPKRFYLGSSTARAQLLASVIAGIWQRHGHEWRPQALDQVAAAFRANDEQLACLAAEHGAGVTAEVQLQVLRSRRPDKC